MKQQNMLKNGVSLLIMLLSIAVNSSVVSAQTDSLLVEGVNRKMIVYAPDDIPKKRPLLISMHGANQDAGYQQSQAKYESIADTAKFVLVYPDGINRRWDISGDSDINFILSIIDEMAKRYERDRNRVK